MRKFFLKSILALSLLAVFSCEKQEDPIVLPPAGNTQQLVAPMGSDYRDQVYVSLSNQKVSVVSDRQFDLAFETAPGSFAIYLNNAKYMFAARSGSSVFHHADSTGLAWRPDAEHLDPDSTALGPWWKTHSNHSLASKVFFIDRGQLDHTGNDRYRKFQVLYADSNLYRVKFSGIHDTACVVMDIPKDGNYSLMYLSLSGSGALINQAPPKTEWDFVFTRYTHVYFDQPLSSPFRFYPVCGVVVNKWNGTKACMLEKDSTQYYSPYEQFSADQLSNITFSPYADAMGFDWKLYDFGSASYYMAPYLFFILRDNRGWYYKIRFTDFYDNNGNRGTISMEYQRL